ncbi:MULTISPECIES: GAF and ANTAR domain-containing protein [Actinomadura]|uniref:GAF and ANTAR domain-containing protein n=1 Tax=Actinomadura yumaensis TaxID=111807 RepID=A0ABW2CLL9_9ACTN|nr:GAF and ANTAR domain-containing protein [Actinomadura sp. J1-007]MWK40638.1 hypothetical protein [Actinomadura sp. J1-007]
MVSDEQTAAWGLIAESARRRGGRMAAQDVCLACADSIAVTGVGLSLLAGGRLEPTHVVGELARRLLEAQLTSGDGPCVEAVTTGAPVLAADLSSAACGRRWPLFTAVARNSEVRAVFAFPLATGAVRVGVLVLARARPGPLSDVEQGRAFFFADAALALLLDERARDTTVESGADAGVLPVESLALGAQVHQAAGMVSVQLDTDVEEALVRMRAHAFAHDMALSEVARRVVERALRFAPDPLTRRPNGRD